MEERNTPVLEGLPDERGPIVECVGGFSFRHLWRKFGSTRVFLSAVLATMAGVWFEERALVLVWSPIALSVGSIIFLALFISDLRNEPEYDPDDELTIAERWTKWKNKYFKMS